MLWGGALVSMFPFTEYKKISRINMTEVFMAGVAGALCSLNQWEGDLGKVHPCRVGVLVVGAWEGMLSSILGHCLERANLLREMRNYCGQPGLGGLVPIQFSQQPTSIWNENSFLNALIKP